MIGNHTKGKRNMAEKISLSAAGDNAATVYARAKETEREGCDLRQKSGRDRQKNLIMIFRWQIRIQL